MLTVGEYLIRELKIKKGETPSLYYSKSDACYYRYYPYYKKYVPISEHAIKNSGVVNLAYEHKKEIQFMTAHLVEHNMLLQTWQKNFAVELKHAHINAYMLGKGGYENMTYSDWGKIGAKLKKEYGYLNNFANEIAAENLTEKQIIARAELYANGIMTSYHKGREAAVQDWGYTHAQRFLGAAEHCSDCIEYAGMGIQKIGVLPVPGEKSQCMHNCQCSIEYYTPGEAEQKQGEKLLKDEETKQKTQQIKSTQMPTDTPPRSPDMVSDAEKLRGDYYPNSDRYQRISPTYKDMPRDLQYDVAEHFYNGRMDFHASHITYDGEMKNDVVTFLSQKTQLDYDVCNDLVKTWARTSNDRNYQSLSLQKAAADKWGVELSEWQKEKLDDILYIRNVEKAKGRALLSQNISTFEDINGNIIQSRLGIYGSEAEAYDAFLQAMYDHTQDLLETLYPGQSSITLWRGTSLHQDAYETMRSLGLANDHKARDIYEIRSNALESWSINFDIGEGFALDNKNPHALVYEAEIPINRVIATARSGLGCWDEYEFVVLGGVEGDQAVVIRYYFDSAHRIP